MISLLIKEKYTKAMSRPIKGLKTKIIGYFLIILWLEKPSFVRTEII